MPRLRRGQSNALALVVSVAILGGGGALVTKPSQRDHVAAVREHCREAAGFLGAAGCEVALGAGQTFGLVTYDDYIVYSRLRIQDRVLSVGVFGTVMVQEDAAQL